jgi:hypothetical protein
MNSFLKKIIISKPILPIQGRQKFMETTTLNFGLVSILVNNACIATRGLLQDLVDVDFGRDYLRNQICLSKWGWI